MRRRRGRGAAECIFLWHASLESSLRSSPSNSAGLRNQETPSSAHLPSSTPQLCASNSADLRFAYKEIEKTHEENQLKYSSSSSDSDTSTTLGDLGPEPTTTSPLDENGNPTAWCRCVANWLKQYRQVKTLPDQQILSQILAGFDGPEDFERYVWYREQNQIRRIESYAWFLTDIKFWPEKRAEVAAIFAREQAAVADRESREGQYRKDEQQENLKLEAVFRHRAIPDCPHCGRAGVIRSRFEAAPDIVTWCECEHVACALERHGNEYPDRLTAEAAEAWPKEQAGRRFDSQTKRFSEHYERLTPPGSRATPALVNLQCEFFASACDLPKREEILRRLDAGEIEQLQAKVPEATTPAPIPPQNPKESIWPM